MKWQQCLPVSFLAALYASTETAWISQCRPLARAESWTSARKNSFREATRSLWYHGYNNYMNHGRGPDWENPTNIAYNDVAGNFSVTLVDVLDTLVVLDDPSGFQSAVRNVIDWVSFDVNTKPQVFETTIRVLGGLLSGHIFASQPDQPFFLPWYRGQLLDMAHDLGKRLLPAFATPTGLPFARLNLRHGVFRGESLDTCTAGAGSLILEFGTLSRLTGDDRFEKVAYKAFFALWNRRSDIGLVGNTINILSGMWTAPEITGIGAGIDSFYEYALKWYVLTGEVEFLDVWHEAYAAVMRYTRSPDGYWHRSVNIHTGEAAFSSVDSLSAFWPGLQVLGGDVQNAIKAHMYYWNLWRKHSGLPEVWDAVYTQATSFQYPLRPEFVESTWYLYRATKDPFYLDVGERILKDITIRTKVDCGLASIKDLRLNARDDRMESFALSETLKYLYLLFDEANRLHDDDSHYVFTTEGHILTLPRKALKPMSPARKRLRRVENHQCPAYHPFHTSTHENYDDGLTLGIGQREDVDYVRHIIGLRTQPSDELYSSPHGWCAAPQMELYSYDFILAAHGGLVPEDPSPSSRKLSLAEGGYLLHNVTGIRAHIVSRLDGKGYDITKLGPHAVRTGQLVYVDDPALVLHSFDSDKMLRQGDVKLRFVVDEVDPMLQARPGVMTRTLEMEAKAFTALFGADPAALPHGDSKPPPFSSGNSRIRFLRKNTLGCSPYTQNLEGDVVLVYRGDCAFLEKLTFARDAGASGVIVIGDSDIPINPSATPKEISDAGDLDAVALVLLTQSAGEALLEIMDTASAHGTGHVLVSVDPEGWTAQTESQPSDFTQEDEVRVLYINGHPLLNTRLLT
ncbi:glycoside hydrolase family 47 protein [Coniophora puteana RWD-64-598 SS2]|uniref:alpha-1,2-Mannosidase n=1 Tax=Coniophora puteana (strain RWD-64-598) TaxID=741705 RepID=A0A5M3MUJ2_CONPW|nr:glycoside hydrolase family 47 protein [Coniophora puteana RWD-64-598 SS2]EIW82385.1 glycoside hydrolase family 47 protein [Coniophora puteana RWD-64-598 SS2]